MPLVLKPLDQQVIVITGASSGIGLATAYAALERGARVVLVARSGQVLDRIIGGATGHQGHAAAVVADVGDRAQVRRVAQVAIVRFGGIDTWVNNAGVSIHGRLEEVLEEDARRLFDTNFWGVVNGSLTALPFLKRDGGALINIGCELADALSPLRGFHTASKRAVKGFTDTLRAELASEGAPISVTLIQPPAVDTPYAQHARSYLDREPRLPRPRIDPYVVADAILGAAVRPVHDVDITPRPSSNFTTDRVAPAARGTGRRSARMTTVRDPAGALHLPGGDGRIIGEPAEAGEASGAA